MKRQRGDAYPAFDYQGHGATYLNGVLQTEQTHSLQRMNGRFMQDETNQLWSNPRLRKKYLSRIDVGSPMNLQKVEWDFPIQGSGAGSIGALSRRYDGPICAYMPAGYPTDLYLPAKAAAYAVADPAIVRWGLGGQAIAACRPAQPEASFGQFIIELYREGVPSLLQRLDVKDKVEFFRGLGSNYLNVEFGWKPFVSDIQKTVRALHDADAILDDLYRHNGQYIRRRYTFPEIQTVATETDAVLPWPTLTTAHWSQNSRTVRTTTTKKTWFSGEFMYHLPPRGDAWSNLRVRTRHLLGADLTPELLWNVSPWTWLLDWFGSIGDLISNFTAISSDNLVLRYGYLMQEASREVHCAHLGVATKGYGQVNSTVTGVLRISNKTRILASPYGFGLTQGDLTPRQWAILIALGLVKNPGGIRNQNG